MYTVEDSLDSDVYGSFSSFRDIAIQERLLEADDEILAKEILNREIRASRWQKNGSHNSNIDGTNPVVSDSCVGKNNNGSVQKCKSYRTAPFCGWHVDPNVVYRRSENIGLSKSKPATGSVSKDISVARDSKSKTFSSEDFIFQHYLETNHYIEQYRQQHTCSDTVTLLPARSDLSDLRKPHSDQQYSPMTVFSQTVFQQDASLASPQLDSLLAQMSGKQHQTQNKPPLVTTTQFANKREQQLHRLHSKLKNSKKTFSPPTSSYDMSKVMNITDSTPASSQSKRISSAKELVLIPAVIDIPVLKNATNMMKVQTLNIDSLPEKNSRLPKPGPILDTITGSHLLGHRVGFSVPNQTKMLDATAFRLGSGNEKQSSGSQKITCGTDTHLEQTAVASKQELTSKPAQLVMTGQCKEGLPQSRGPDLNEKVQVLQPSAVRSSKSDIFRSGIEMVALANSLHQKLHEKHSLRLEEISKQNQPCKQNSLLAVTGHDCCKTRKFVYDHLTSIRKQNDKQMLSHKRRIQQLIEQSKLKHKFNQTLNVSKAPGKTILEIKSIQITDPFVKAVPGSNRNSNNNWKAGQNITCDVCCCVVDCKNNNHMNSYNRKDETVQRKIAVNCSEMSAQDEEVQFDSTPSYDNSIQDYNDKGFPCIDLAMSTDGLELSSPQSKHSSVSSTDKSDVKIHSDRGVYEACGPASGVRLPQSKLKQACLNKSYFHQLTNEVSKMTVAVPKLRCPEFSLVCKSHSSNL